MILQCSYTLEYLQKSIIRFLKIFLISRLTSTVVSGGLKKKIEKTQSKMYSDLTGEVGTILGGLLVQKV